jgi:hypothetical protein
MTENKNERLCQARKHTTEENEKTRRVVVVL